MDTNRKYIVIIDDDLSNPERDLKDNDDLLDLLEGIDDFDIQEEPPLRTLLSSILEQLNQELDQDFTHIYLSGWEEFNLLWGSGHLSGQNISLILLDHNFAPLVGDITELANEPQGDEIYTQLKSLGIADRVVGISQDPETQTRYLRQNYIGLYNLTSLPKEQAIEFLQSRIDRQLPTETKIA